MFLAMQWTPQGSIRVARTLHLAVTTFYVLNTWQNEGQGNSKGVASELC